MINESQFAEIFLNSTPLIDVRAPVEFGWGHIPNSVCLPILSDNEREKVGTTYKEKGQESAIELGHKLVSGEVKEARLAAWENFILKNPSAMIFCFRGGLRSKTAQAWLDEAGIKIPRVEGGYKALRSFLMSETQKFSENKKLLVISGPTGAGKSLVINEAIKFYPTLDLEGLAHHRGSAFGNYLGEPQPTQITFENQLAERMLQLKDETRNILIEDESRMIGRCVQPDTLFASLRNSPVVLVDEGIDSRVQTTYNEYILETPLNNPAASEAQMTAVYDSFKQATTRITKKLGGAKTAEVLSLIAKSELELFLGKGLESNKDWIKELLVNYYDPLYLGSLEKRNPKILFVGPRKSVLEYLHDNQTQRFMPDTTISASL